MAELEHPSRLFWLVTTPARWLGRFRPDLAASLRDDAATFRGPMLRLFALLALVAVAYPIVASLIHAMIGPLPGDTHLGYALRPYIAFVYSESLPFMITVAGIGAFSPALGILLLLVFAPADLWATSVAFPIPNQLTPTLPAIAARLISYAVLWILAVEIPLRARSWAAGWGGGLSASPSRFLRSGVLAAGTATLVFFWASALIWLIQPVVNWTVFGGGYISVPIVVATQVFWPILVIGAGLIAAVAGMLQRPEVPLAEGGEPAGEASAAGQLGRQLITIAVLAALLSGLMTGWVERVLIVGGLVLAGPVLSWLLPRLRVPGWIARVPTSARYVAAVGMAFGVTWLVLVGGPLLGVVGTAYAYEGTLPDNVVVAALLAVVMPVFRIIIDAGTGVEPPGATTAPLPPVITAALGLLLMAVVWLAIPALALADDFNEKGQANSNLLGTGALIGGAAALAGGALRSGKEPPPYVPPKKKEPNPPPWYVPDSFADAFGYDPPAPPPPPKKPPVQGPKPY